MDMSVYDVKNNFFYNCYRDHFSSFSLFYFNMEKPTRTFALFRTSSNDLSQLKRLNIGLTPYLLEQLPRKSIVSYGILLFRVELNVLRKFLPRLNQPDIQVLQKAIKEGKTWQAHYIGRTHRISKPIEVPKGNENFKYIKNDDPIIIRLISENPMVKEYLQQYTINWVLLTIKPSLLKEIMFRRKAYEFRKSITKVPKKDEKAIKKALHNPIKYGKQDLSIKSKNKRVERGKIILAYIYGIIDKIQAYICDKTAESKNYRYNALRDSFILFVLNHLKQFNITANQVFSSIPLKLSSRKYSACKWKKIHRMTWEALIEKYNPGNAEAAS